MSDVYIATAGYNVKIHDPITYTTLSEFTPTLLHGSGQETPSHAATASDISWSVDRKCLAVLPGGGPVQIIQLKEGKISKVTVADVGTIEPTAVSFVTNCNRYLAIGTKSGELVIWDCKPESIRKSFSSVDRHGEVLQVHCNVYANHIATSMSTGEILVYDYANPANKEMIFQPRNSKPVSAMCFQSTGHNSWLAAGTKDGRLCCWNTMNGKQIYDAARCHAGAVKDVAFSRVNHNLLASVSGCDLCIHDLVAGKDSMLRIATGLSLTSVDLCPGGCVAALGTATGHLVTYDLRSYHKPLFSQLIHDQAVHRVRFTPTSRQEAGGRRSGSATTPASSASHSLASPRNRSHAESPATSRVSDLASTSLFSPVGTSLSWRVGTSLPHLETGSDVSSTFSMEGASISPEQDVKPNVSTLLGTSSTPRVTELRKPKQELIPPERPVISPVDQDTPSATAPPNRSYARLDCSLFSPLAATDDEDEAATSNHELSVDSMIFPVFSLPADINEENQTHSQNGVSNGSISQNGDVSNGRVFRNSDVRNGSAFQNGGISNGSTFQSTDARHGSTSQSADVSNGDGDRAEIAGGYAEVLAEVKRLDSKIMFMEDNILERIDSMNCAMMMRFFLAEEREKRDQAQEIARLKEENHFLRQVMKRQ